MVRACRVWLAPCLSLSSFNSVWNGDGCTSVHVIAKSNGLRIQEGFSVAMSASHSEEMEEEEEEEEDNAPLEAKVFTRANRGRMLPKMLQSGSFCLFGFFGI